ncbi:MAG: HAMP domain-containing histidine kinase [Betaproteobacteria bacterium]|nr:HAMP domain-containing histidine kinase [Betaproteobacteria bacterium]
MRHFVAPIERVGACGYNRTVVQKVPVQIVNPAHAGPASATRENLRRLVVLRYFVLAALGLALAGAHFAWYLPLRLEPVGAMLALLAVLNVLEHARLRVRVSVSDFEFFGNLLGDVLGLTLVLYFTGGSTNPLVSLYLLPLMIAATVLPARFNWYVAALAVACYSMLLVWYVPLGEQLHDHSEGAAQFNLHVLGMWATFVVSTGLIAHFVASMAHSLRERDRLLAQAREGALKNERIVALGTLAAGAAHELGTPLATMTLLADDMARRYFDRPDLREDTAELQTQLANCKAIIGSLADSAGAARGESGHAQAADSFLDEVLAKWLLLRPAARVDCHWSDATPAPTIVVEQTLFQAVINLFNNAADASPSAVEIVGRNEADNVVIEILDRGPGLSADVARRAGEAFFSTKSPSGLGIGLFLANATIERFGGRVRIVNRQGGGACTQITLPILAPGART